MNQGALNRSSATTLAESAPQVLGIACAGNLIGYFRINMKQTQATADGGVGTLKYSRNDGTSWANTGNGTVMVNYPQRDEILEFDSQPASSVLQGATNSSVPLSILPDNFRKKHVRPERAFKPQWFGHHRTDVSVTNGQGAVEQGMGSTRWTASHVGGGGRPHHFSPPHIQPSHWPAS